MANFKSQFQQTMDNYIEETVASQDFHAIETPLKSDAQYKKELKANLQETLSFNTLFEPKISAIQIIKEYLEKNDSVEAQKIEQEIIESMSHFSHIKKQLKEKNSSIEEYLEKLGDRASTWVALFGISDNTLDVLYDIVLEKIEQREFQKAKDLLNLMILYAPGITAYWNAIGFIYQKQGLYQEAIQFYNLSKEINSQDIETHIYLARCYENAKDFLQMSDEINELKHLIAQSKDLQKEWSSQIDKLEILLKR